MKKNIIRIAIVTAVILMVPLVAMQFSEEVKWTFSDFVVMGALIFSTGCAIDWATRKASKKHRVAAVVAILAVFLLIWVQLAVGIVDAPFSGQ